MAIISFEREVHAKKVCDFIEKLGYRCVERALFEAMKRPTKFISGLLTGAIASRSKEELERVVKLETKRLAIPGLVDVMSTHDITTSGNKILKLRVDNEAYEALEKVQFDLHLASSGKVRFNDPTKTKKVDNNAKLQDLQQRIAEDKKKILEMEAKEADLKEKLETDSVASLGLSKMQVEAGEETEKTTDEVMLDLLDDKNDV